MSDWKWFVTDSQIMRMIPKAKKAGIREVYQDSDGIWIILKEGWNADNIDITCRTIHCGGEDESRESTLKDLRYQIDGIRKL